jgi:dihydropteroate synthase
MIIMVKLKVTMIKTATRESILNWRRLRGKEAPGTTVCADKIFRWGERTYVMGVINMSPDSISGDGLDNPDKALKQAEQFVTEGVDILDVGGESTRPGSAPITNKEEIDRIVPVLKRLAGKVKVPLSVDTYKVEVAQACLDAGADMINDIWGLQYEPELARLAADRKVPVILMSNQRNKPAKHIVPAVIADLKRAIDTALDAGVAWEDIIIDPGIGFGKKLEQNYELIRRLDELKILGRPVLLGTSRKSMIGLTLNVPENDRLEGTAATNAIGIFQGADIIRVHDVHEMIRIARMSDAIIRRRER